MHMVYIYLFIYLFTSNKERYLTNTPFSSLNMLWNVIPSFIFEKYNSNVIPVFLFWKICY